jgi:hypothetical protein
VKRKPPTAKAPNMKAKGAAVTKDKSDTKAAA